MGKKSRLKKQNRIANSNKKEDIPISTLIKEHVPWLFSGLGLSITNTIFSFFLEKYRILYLKALLILVIFSVVIVLLNKNFRAYLKTSIIKLINKYKESKTNKIIIIIGIILIVLVWNSANISREYKFFRIKQIEKEADIEFDKYNFETAKILYEKAKKISDEPIFDAWKDKKTFLDKQISIMTMEIFSKEFVIKKEYEEKKQEAFEFFKKEEYFKAVSILEHLLKYLNQDFSVSLNYYKLKINLDLASNYLHLVDYTNSRRYINEAFRFLKDISPKNNDYDYLNFSTNYSYGLLLFEEGKYRDSLTYYLKAKEFIEDVKAENIEAYLKLMNDISSCYAKISDFDSAETISIQAEDYILSFPNGIQEFTDSYQNILATRAIFYSQIGEDKKSIDIINKFFKLFPNNGSRIIDIFSVQVKNIKNPQMDKLYETALLNYHNKLIKTSGNANTMEIARINNLLGNLYVIYGDEEIESKAKSIEFYYEAEKYFLKSYEIRGNILNKESPDYAIGLNNMGLVYQKLEKYSSAEEYFRKAMIISVKMGDNDYFYSQALHNLAFVLATQKKYDEAIKLFSKAVDIRRRVLGVENNDFVDALLNYASCLISASKKTEAKKVLEEVLLVLDSKKSSDAYKRIKEAYDKL